MWMITTLCSSAMGQAVYLRAGAGAAANPDGGGPILSQEVGARLGKIPARGMAMAFELGAGLSQRPMPDGLGLFDLGTASFVMGVGYRVGMPRVSSRKDQWRTFVVRFKGGVSGSLWHPGDPLLFFDLGVELGVEHHRKGRRSTAWLPYFGGYQPMVEEGEPLPFAFTWVAGVSWEIGARIGPEATPAQTNEDEDSPLSRTVSADPRARVGGPPVAEFPLGEGEITARLLGCNRRAGVVDCRFEFETDGFSRPIEVSASGGDGCWGALAIDDLDSQYVVSEGSFAARPPQTECVTGTVHPGYPASVRLRFPSVHEGALRFTQLIFYVVIGRTGQDDRVETVASVGDVPLWR